MTFAIKAAGPVTLVERELPDRFDGIIRLMAPGVLAALVVTSALADGGRLSEPTRPGSRPPVFWRGGRWSRASPSPPPTPRFCALRDGAQA